MYSWSLKVASQNDPLEHSTLTQVTRSLGYRQGLVQHPQEKDVQVFVFYAHELGKATQFFGAETKQASTIF